MPPMSDAETGSYLRHHQTSRGYPRAVNNLACKSSPRSQPITASSPTPLRSQIQTNERDQNLSRPVPAVGCDMGRLDFVPGPHSTASDEQSSGESQKFPAFWAVATPCRRSFVTRHRALAPRGSLTSTAAPERVGVPPAWG